jgi:hypothetical protein
MKDPYSITPEVQAVGNLDFTGNVIPHHWYQALIRENGKPNTVAIILLSEIVYWYRPSEDRCEATGKLLGYKKKFKADFFQRQTKDFASFFGFSEKQVRDGLAFLEEKGIIQRHFRDIRFNSGGSEGVVSNRQFIQIFPKALYDLQKIQKIHTYCPESQYPLTLKEGGSNLNVTYTENTSQITPERKELEFSGMPVESENGISGPTAAEMDLKFSGKPVECKNGVPLSPIKELDKSEEDQILVLQQEEIEKHKTPSFDDRLKKYEEDFENWKLRRPIENLHKIQGFQEKYRKYYEDVIENVNTLQDFDKMIEMWRERRIDETNPFRKGISNKQIDGMIGFLERAKPLAIEKSPEKPIKSAQEKESETVKGKYQLSYKCEQKQKEHELRAAALDPSLFRKDTDLRLFFARENGPQVEAVEVSKVFAEYNGKRYKDCTIKEALYKMYLVNPKLKSGFWDYFEKIIKQVSHKKNG